MKVTCVSDLHGYTPELPGGDLLIVAGDLTANDEPEQYDLFFDWMAIQPYDKIVWIAGNHDNLLQQEDYWDRTWLFKDISYLQDSGCEYKGYKIWGSPWTLNFFGQNPKAQAFGVVHESCLMDKFNQIPQDTQILVTHTPCYGILDGDGGYHRYGSTSLRAKVTHELDDPVLHVFGHVHEGYGKLMEGEQRGLRCSYVNASHVNTAYHNVNQPITIELP